jgi:hypothetical protein
MVAVVGRHASAVAEEAQFLSFNYCRSSPVDKSMVWSGWNASPGLIGAMTCHFQ